MILLAFYYGDEFEKWTTREGTRTTDDTIRFHVTFAKLYLRSRLAGYAIVGLVAATVLGYVGAHVLLIPEYGIPDKVIKEILTLASLIVPLIAACVIGLGARSPFGEEEETASLLLPLVRFCHLGGLFACGVFMLSLIALSWELEHAGWVLTRNLAGLTGLALLTARVVGSGLSWVGPFAYSILAVTVNILSDNPPKGEWTMWTWWPLQPATDFPPVVVALTLLVFGLGSVCLYRVHS